MADAPTSQAAETSTTEEDSHAPRVAVLLTPVEGADLDAALAIVRRQSYEPAPDIVLIGNEEEIDGARSAETLEQAIVEAGSDTDYLWLLHADARPRPDALSKLVAEIERNDASLAGSKLLIAGTRDNLESVGSATDVFGEPYSGLEEGEIDLQQYDVVREVAFVGSASMLVRRDLAQGLKGLDVLLPPVAAGLDFSQRARLAGARVIIVPSSEVFHQGRCNELGRGWREQAGRLRAMLTAYSPLTLLWVVPYDFLVSILDSLGNLLLLRWRPAARHVRSWLWNLYHLPSTIGLRRRFRPVRASGDEELFRFQGRGSVRLRQLGSELSSRFISVFDDDQVLAKSSRRLGSSPGIWGAAVAALVVLVGVRGLVFAGVPDIGYSFPFEPPTLALDRWFAGWNESGLGAPDPVHPAVGLTGALSWVLFGAEAAARTLATIAFGIVGVLGLGRLAGRLGLRGPGRYLAGIVAVGGPGVAALTGAGSWLALGAAAILPWAVRASASHPDERHSHFTRYGWAVFTGLVLASFSPLLAVVPLATVMLWTIWGGSGARFGPAIALLLAGSVASAAFVLGDNGWVLDADRRLGLETDPLWTFVIGAGGVAAGFLDNPARRLGLTGALLSLSGLLLNRLALGGPGYEEASLVLAGFGAALVVAAGLDNLSSRARSVAVMLPAIALLALALGSVANGRLGLPAGDTNERFGFSSTLAGEDGPGRILVASVERDLIPGEARPGPGFWYRLVDANGMTLDEVWLPGDLPGDQALRNAIAAISSSSRLRPGDLLGPFAIDWVVLAGPEFRLDEAFVAQLDLVPTPLDPASRVFENTSAAPIADAGPDATWVRSGTGFEGDRTNDGVGLAINFDAGWGPEAERNDWAVSVSGSAGEATYAGEDADLALAISTAALAVVALGLIVAGRIRR